MDEKVLQARVGIVVISALLLTAILVVLFGDMPSFFKGGRTIYVKFPTAPGISEGTPVRKSGILIGRVQTIRFADDSSDVVVSVQIDDGTELRKNEVCRISSDSLLGDAVLEFQPEGPTTNELIPEGSYIEGFARPDPLNLLTSLEGDLRRTLVSMANAGDKVGQLADSMGNIADMTDPQQLKQTWAKAGAALDQVNKAMTRVNDLLDQDDIRKQLQETLDNFPKAISETRSAMAAIEQAAHRADRNFQNLEGLTGPLSEQGPEIVDRVESIVSQLDDATALLADFTERFGEDDGTIGKLLRDPELYDNLNRTVLKVERLATDVRPILNDVRVFSDKIARDPGRLGVSGALQRNRENSKYPNYKFVEPPPHHWRSDLAPPDDWREPPVHHGQVH